MTEQVYAAPAGIYGPVTDWATDLDHADPTYNPRAPEIWTELRESGCPVAHSDRYNGMWAPLTAELVREVAYDTDRFTSRSVVVSTSRIEAQRPIGAAPPITSDPPFHALARRLLLPPFVPKQIEPWEPEIRKLCRAAPRRHGPDRRRRDRHRRRPAVRPAHPGQRHRPHARLPPRGRRPLPRVRPRCVGRRQPRSGGAPGRVRRARQVHRCADRRATATSRATISRRTCSTPSSAVRSCPTSTCVARSCCCSSPASTRRGARSGRVCGTSPRIPTTAAGWSPSRS